ncbi:MAG: exo-alpha-sialidase [Candidatus Solibacter usitatus]|nr:exo-alpha-sialidase [Candidatus Solibacter usitatus]
MLLLLAAVTLIRVPDSGIQPQAHTDASGRIHLLYFQGQPGAGDLFYRSSADAGKSWSSALRVNTRPNSAIATGNIRGAHLALGRNGRPHVAWMGSGQAEPKSGMFYTRLDAAGKAFEPERNLVTKAWGLDGGGTLAADGGGRVYVLWHAPTPGTRGEENRQVWVATSTDDGASFAAERPAWPTPTGACGCCGMRAHADADGKLRVLYRGTQLMVHRDMYLLTSTDGGGTFEGRKIDEWEVGACVMSTAWLSEGTSAWETRGQVHAQSGALPLTAPNQGKRKHPIAVRNGRGNTLLLWTENMGWNRGGSLAWQLFDVKGTSAEHGDAPGVPVWSLVSAVALPSGDFVVLY